MLEYCGELIPESEAKLREEQYSKDERIGSYMFYFRCDTKVFCIDATVDDGRLGRLVNHSLGHGNSKMKRDLNSMRLKLYAKCDISEDTEITYDYGDRSQESVKANPWLLL